MTTKYITPYLPRQWNILVDSALREQRRWAEEEERQASPFVAVGCTGIPIRACEMTATVKVPVETNSDLVFGSRR